MHINRRNILNLLIISPLLLVVTKVQAFFGEDEVGHDDFNELDGDVAYEPDELDAVSPKSEKNKSAIETPVDPFEVKLIYMKEQIAARKFTVVIAYIEKLGVQKNRIYEAKRLFSLARAFAGRKKYARAINLNEKALQLKPSLITSRFNNACYAALSSQGDESLRHLRLLVQYIVSRKSNQRKRFLNLIKTDADLVEIRPLAEYEKLVDKLEFAKF